MNEPIKQVRKVVLEGETALVDTSWDGVGSTREGWVGTKQGVVLAYVEFKGRDAPRTVLRFTYGGRIHTWIYRAAYKDRYVGRLAAKMTRILSGGD